MTRSVSGPAAVIINKYVSGTGKSLRNHVGVVLTDDPFQFFFRGVIVVWADLPDDVSALLIDDKNDVGFPSIYNDIVRVKALVTLFVPFVWTKD